MRAAPPRLLHTDAAFALAFSSLSFGIGVGFLAAHLAPGSGIPAAYTWRRPPPSAAEIGAFLIAMPTAFALAWLVGFLSIQLCRRRFE